MLERDIERKLREGVMALGGQCWKLVSPGTAGVPDRLVLMPGGRLAFVELKAPGRKERPIQRVVQARLVALGFMVFSTVDSLERVNDVLLWCKGGGMMARLIDADALKDNMFSYAPPEMTWGRGDIEHKIDEMPTIDAIPVEWLKAKCEKFGQMARGGH